MVRGVSEDGKRVTAVELASLGGSLFSGPAGTWSAETWLCGYAVEAHFDLEDPVIFTAGSVGLTYLSSWLQSPRPKTKFTSDSYRLKIEMKSLAEVEHEGSVFDFSGIGGTTSGFDATTVDFPTIVHVTPPTALRLEDLVNSMVVPIESLLWVATGVFSDTDLHVRIDGDHPLYGKVWVSPLRPTYHQPPNRRLVRNEMLFTANDLPGGLDGGLRRWLEVWSDLQPALGPVIARHRAPFSYADDRFATSVAGLESYSALRHGEHEISREERNQRIAAVDAALRSGAPELVDWVVEALERAHRHTLRSRLNRLLDEAGELTDALLGSHREEFVSAVIQSRDQVAHSLARRGGISGGGAMHWTSRGFVWLLRYLAMTELGFTDDESRERVHADSKFQGEAKLLKQVLSAASTE
jgi:hypothetical protein